MYLLVDGAVHVDAAMMNAVDGHIDLLDNLFDDAITGTSDEKEEQLRAVLTSLRAMAAPGAGQGEIISFRDSSGAADDPQWA